MHTSTALIALIVDVGEHRGQAGQLGGQVDRLAEPGHSAGSQPQQRSSRRGRPRAPPPGCAARDASPAITCSGAASAGPNVAPGGTAAKPETTIRVGRTAATRARARPWRRRGPTAAGRRPPRPPVSRSVTRSWAVPDHDTSTWASATHGSARSLERARPSSTSSRCWPSWMPATATDGRGRHVGRAGGDHLVHGQQRAVGHGPGRPPGPRPPRRPRSGAGVAGRDAPGRRGRAGPGSAGRPRRSGRPPRSSVDPGRVPRVWVTNPRSTVETSGRSRPGGSRARGGRRWRRAPGAAPRP